MSDIDIAVADADPNQQTVRVVRLLDTHKAKLAFAVPFVTAVLTAVSSWIISGDFNDTEIRAALGGTALSISSAIATFLAPAGRAVVKQS